MHHECWTRYDEDNRKDDLFLCTVCAFCLGGRIFAELARAHAFPFIHKRQILADYDAEQV